MFITNSFVSTLFSLVISMIGYRLVNGCGQFPQGEVNAMSFMASGFTIPAEMAYSEAAEVRNGITTISHSKNAAIKVVQNLIMNAVDDVLQEQGRNALLPDAVIQQILQQLNVTVEYTPLECKTATKDPANGNVPPQAGMGGCLIIENLVKGICTMGAAACKLMPFMNVGPPPEQHRMLRGSLRTSNVIMANWSRQMWQSILNRVFIRITTGRFREYFSTAVVTVTN